MRLLIAAAIVGTALVTDAASQSPRDSRSDSLERAFVANGRISMDLSAGEYRISASPDHRIRLDWTVRYANDLPGVIARANVNGTNASITLDGPQNSFKGDIQVPSRADLYVRMTAGELHIEHIQGDKDIGLHAGELDIDVGKPEDYGRVEASVWAGELNAGPFGAVREGLFRSFDWSGKGPYRLTARLKAGELRLRGERTAAR